METTKALKLQKQSTSEMDGKLKELQDRIKIFNSKQKD